MVEQSLVFIKPDGVKRGLIGQVVTRFENKGFDIKELKMMDLTEDLVDRHYQEHIEKGFYPDLKEYVMSGSVVVMVIEGESVIAHIRKMVGATNPLDAEQGSIRGDFAVTTSYNIVHASDSVESAKREIGSFFSLVA